MASGTINTINQLQADLTLDGTWSSRSSSHTATKGFFILTKSSNNDSSYSIKLDDIISVQLQIGLDIGETDGYMVIDSYDFLFPKKKISECKDVNDRTSFIKINQTLPKHFYYRVSAIETKNKIYKIGDKIEGNDPTAEIKLNIQELDY